MGQLELFTEWLPDRPYCTEALGSLRILPAVQALKKRYIQPNKPFDLRWLVYDVDRETAYIDWWDTPLCPAPSIIVYNRENGHCHFLYALTVPVYTQPEAHQAPLRFAAAVDVALTIALGADPGYAGLLCKNPLHEHWWTTVWQQEPYDLPWLSDSLDMEPYRDKRRHLPAIGLGRNCTLFEVTRRFAYTHRRVCPERALFTDIYAYAGHYNESRFQYPLPVSEVRATARSVTKWVIRRMDDEGFLDWCHRRARYGNKKSQEVRIAQAEERAEEISAYQQEHPESTTRLIGEVLGVSAMTISRRNISTGQTRQAKVETRAEEIRAYKQEHPDVTREELSILFDVSEFTLKGLSLGMAETRQQARQTKAANRAEEIRAYKEAHPEATIREIANILGFGRDMVHRALSN
jgi:hypothetical protein